MGKTAPLGAVSLAYGEGLHVVPGKMQAESNVSMVTEVASGVWESLKRLFFGGASFFNNRFVGNQGGGWVLLEENIPGQNIQIDLKKGQEIKVRGNCLIASSPELELTTVYTGLLGKLQGTGLSMVQATLKADAQKGKILIHCPEGAMKEIKIGPKETVGVDNNCIVAYTTEDPSFKLAGGADITSAVFGREGLVCEFHGEGKVYIGSAPDKPRLHREWE